MATYELGKYIPPRYIESEVDESIKLDITKSWYLSGDVGTGKTHFCYALRRRNILRNNENPDHPGIWIHVVNMAEFSSVLRTETIEKRAELMQNMKEKKFLILDDIGSESQSDFLNDVLFQILNHRYEYFMWTGFTSNFRLGKLPYESRIISRIAGIVGDNRFEIAGKDRRISGLH